MKRYEDVELAGEAVGDVADQALPLFPHGDVTDGAGDAESLGLPLLQALGQLRLCPGAGVHGRPPAPTAPPPPHTCASSHRRTQIPHMDSGDSALAQANREIPDAASATGDDGCLAVKRPSPRTGADRFCRGHPLPSADFPAALRRTTFVLEVDAVTASDFTHPH